MLKFVKRIHLIKMLNIYNPYNVWFPNLSFVSETFIDMSYGGQCSPIMTNNEDL